MFKESPITSKIEKIKKDDQGLTILRHKRKSTYRLGLYFLPVDPTIADTILDRLVHNAHKIKLNGESMRQKNANLT